MKIENSSHYQAIQALLKQKLEDDKDNLNVEGEPEVQMQPEFSNTVSVGESASVQNVSGSSLTDSHQPPHFEKHDRDDVFGYCVWLIGSDGNEIMWFKKYDEWNNLLLRKQALEEAEKEGLKLEKVYELTPKILDVACIPESKREQAIRLLLED